MKEIDLITRN